MYAMYTFQLFVSFANVQYVRSRSCSLVVITLDFESRNLSSNLGRIIHIFFHHKLGINNVCQPGNTFANSEKWGTVHPAVHTLRIQKAV